MKNFTCPNCKAAATLKDIVPNKKLREIISWFKELTNDNTINIQNQNTAGNQLNSFSNMNVNYLNNLKGFVSAKPKEVGKEGFVPAANATAPTAPYQFTAAEAGKLILSKEGVIDEKLSLLKSQTAPKSILMTTAKEKESFNSQSAGSDEKPKSANVNLKLINPNNLFSNSNENYNRNNLNNNTNVENFQNFEDVVSRKDMGIRRESLDNNEKLRISDKVKVNNSDQNDINKIEFKKDSNMTPEEKMQLYNKINSDSSVSGSIRKHSEDVNESASQKGAASNFSFFIIFNKNKILIFFYIIKLN